MGNKIILLTRCGLLFFIIYQVGAISSLAVSRANLTSVSATLNNPRPSVVTGVTRGLAGSAQISVATGGNIFSNDTLCFVRENHCLDGKYYQVKSIVDDHNFILATNLPYNLTSDIDAVIVQTSRLTISFTTDTEIPSDGHLVITLPMANNVDGNDGLPEAGFDLNKIAPVDITTNGCSNSDWQTQEIITPGEGLTDHTIRIDRQNSVCPAKSKVTIVIDSFPGLVLPSGQAKTYPLKIQSRDGDANTLDDVIVNVAPIEPVKVTVSVKKPLPYRFKLFGYSSPLALVTVEGVGLSDDQTTAATDGYFEFNELSSFFPTTEPCLTAKDQFGRLSYPVCLPRPPTDRDYNIVIGPIILPPTLSFNRNDYFIGDEVILSGQTIPNSDVNLSLFTDTGKESSKLEAQNPKQIQNSNNLNFKQFKTFENSDLFRVSNLGFRVSDFFVRPVSAFSFPELGARSDDKGNFSIALPSSSSKTYRLFAQTNYNTQSSPKSLTLQFQILPVWLIIFKWLKPHLLTIIILVQIIGLTIYLLRRYLQPKAIILRKHNDLVLEEHEMVKRENLLTKLT